MLELLTEILQNVNENKMRTVLTLMSVAIGAWSIIMILTIGEGFKAFLLENMEKEYISVARTVSCHLGKEKDDDGKKYCLSEREIEDFLLNAPDYIIDILRFSNSNITGELVNEQGDICSNVEVKGVSKGYLNLNNIKLLKGRFITERDCADNMSVAVINEKLAITEFGDIDAAIGETVNFYDTEMYGIQFVIVGVVKCNEEKFEMFCPFSYLDKVKGKEEQSASFQILVTSSAHLRKAEIYLNTFMNKRFATDKDYSFRTFQYDIFTEIERFISIIVYFFVFVGLIIFCVSGISISNIVSAIIVERTCEIGIKKAIGFTNKQIQYEIIIEISFICFIAGIFGCMLGDVTCCFINRNFEEILRVLGVQAGIEKIILQVGILSRIIAILFSILTGVIASKSPLTRISQIETIVAIQQE